MIITAKGHLEEQKIENFNHPAVNLAKKLNEHYDLVAKYYPCFKKLKQIAKALVLAGWLKIKKIPLNINLINSYYQTEAMYISSAKQIKFSHAPRHVKNRSVDTESVG